MPVPPLITLALPVACTTPSVSESWVAPPSSELVWSISAAGLPQTAPGVILLVRITEGVAEVHGTIQADASVDLDGAEDDRHPFRYRVLDDAGEVLYSRSTPGPVQVQEYLAYYEELAGLPIRDLWPELGDFALVVPLLEGAATVDLQWRGADSVTTTIGSYDLAGAVADDVGLSEVITDHETLYDAGPHGARLDLLLVGDGYTADEQDQWHEDAETFALTLRATPPLSDYADLINIHRVDAISAESGVSFDCIDECMFRDTAFGSIFATELVNWVLETDYRTATVFQQWQWEVARAASARPWDIVVVIANTEHSGGFALHYATVPLGSEGRWPQVGVHELAHVLGLLGDEYVKDECVRSDVLGLPPNITDQPAAPPWAHWIDEETPLPTPDEVKYAETTGAFVGAFNCDDLARPNQTCRMLSSSESEFCPVCSEQLIRRIFSFADAVTNVTAEVTEDGWRLTPQVAAAVVGTWTLDGAALAVTTDGEALELPVDALAMGEHTVSVEFQHTAAEVRVDEGELTERWQWTLEVDSVVDSDEALTGVTGGGDRPGED